MQLSLRNIVLPLAEFALEVNAEIRSGMTALFGPSGAGKTSLLDLIAGLRHAQSAFIELNGIVLTDTARRVALPARRRGIGYVPQDLALFPHLSVRRNLLYGHKPARPANPLLKFERIAEVLELEPLLERSIAQLSGGEKQRVALARALLSAPELLLLDEPLANLDMPLKTRIISYLTRVHYEFRVPMLYVTHDRLETLAMAETMIVLVRGKVAQVGPVQEVLNRPANVAVAGLLTVQTIQPGRIVGIQNGLVAVMVGELTLYSIAQNLPTDVRHVFVCIRAEDVILLNTGAAENPSSARNHLRGTVRAITPEGPLMRIDLDCGFPLSALLTKSACEQMALAPGSPVVALIKAPHVHLLPHVERLSAS